MFGKPEGMRHRRRRKSTWEDNVKMDLSDVNGWAWTGFVSGSGQIAGSREHGNEPLSVTKHREFFDYPRNWCFLKRTLFRAVNNLLMSGPMGSNCEGMGRSGFPCE